MQFKYRSEIDGLRFIAVIPVILYHAGFSLFSGGFIGVDVFFVISGYLITTIILNELSNKTFSLKKFYERRARRILPALIFVILVSTVLSFVFLTRTELGNYFKSLNAALFFYSNFYFWKTSPYFKSESDLEPLLHTWSLSIEEQFYIFFPIFLIFFFVFLRKYLFIFFVISFFFSLILCQVFAIKTGGNLNFYFSISRGWELFLGAICAYLLKYQKISFSKIINNILSLLGMALIIFSIFIFSKDTLYPSFYTLFPTAGTALIVLYADKNTLVKKFLSIKVFVGIGLISYSIYLWHQPLLAFGRVYFQNFSNEKKLIILFFSLLLSIFSYYFIEKKFREKSIIKKKNFLKLTFVSIIILFIFSNLNIIFFKKNSTENYLAKLLLKSNAVYSTRLNEREFAKNRILLENYKPKILIIGSSRLMQTSNDMFNKEFFNASVSGASIEDQIAITGMALEKFQLEKIILGADPWLFNKFNNQNRWKHISKEYFLTKENILKSKLKSSILSNQKVSLTFNFYEKILDKIYLFLNLRDLNYDNILKGNEANQKTIILKNGSRILSELEFKNKKLSTVEIKYSMEPFEFSSENYEIYKNFLNYLTSVHKKEIILTMSPYHLPSYELTVKKMPYYLDLEKKIREFAKIKNVKVVGSFNSSLTNCFENEFFDYMHPKNSCLKKIIANLN